MYPVEKCKKRFWSVRVTHTQIFIPVNLSAQVMGPKICSGFLGINTKGLSAVMARSEFRVEVKIPENAESVPFRQQKPPAPCLATNKAYTSRSMVGICMDLMEEVNIK